MLSISFEPYRRSRDEVVSKLLRKHFGGGGGGDPSRLAIAERQFPFRVRADLQRAVEKVLGGGGGAGVVRFVGVASEYMEHTGLDFASLLVETSHTPPVVVPPHYDEVDVGEEQPVRCLKVGLWLLAGSGGRQAVLLSPAGR